MAQLSSLGLPWWWGSCWPLTHCPLLTSSSLTKQFSFHIENQCPPLHEYPATGSDFTACPSGRPDSAGNYLDWGATGPAGWHSEARWSCLQCLNMWALLQLGSCRNLTGTWYRSPCPGGRQQAVGSWSPWQWSAAVVVCAFPSPAGLQQPSSYPDPSPAGPPGERDSQWPHVQSAGTGSICVLTP